MKKAYIVILSLMLPVLFMGCSRKEGGTAADASRPAEKKTLRIMVWGNIDSGVQYQQYFDKQFPEFAEKCTVEYLIGGGGDPECAEKMRLALAANESITDINQLNYTQLGEFTKADALLDLSDFIGPYKDDMLLGFRQMTEYDGKTRAVPASIKAKIWFYRKDIFDQAGLDPANIKTIDDFIAAGKKLQTINPKYKMWTIGPSNPMYNYMMILSGTDASFADSNGNFQLTTNPNFRNVLEAFVKLRRSGVVSDISEWTPDWENAFADEIYVSYPNATWLSNTMFLPTYAGEAQKGKWHTALWPSFISENGGSEAGGDIYVVPVYSAEPELAKEYMKLRFFNADGYFLQKNVGNPGVPMLKSWISDPRANEPDPYIGGNYMETTIKAIDTFKLFPWDPAAALELNIVNSYFDAAANETMNIDNALKGAQADLQNQIGNPWDR